MSTSRSLFARSGPYPSKMAGLGGIPTISTDVPICVIFMVLYIGFGIVNRVLHSENQRKQHKFIPSLLLYGFCASRTVTLALRIAWATHQHDVPLSIAASIFVNVGILLVYIINLILAQRLLRAKQPQFGWNPFVRAAYKVLYLALAVTLVMVIASVVITNYTLNMNTRLICRDISRAAVIFLLVFTCLPVIHIAAAFLMPKSEVEEPFGYGSTKGKVLVLSVSTGLCMLGAGFKTGTSWMPPRPLTDPAWYQSKASLYIFVFVLEILILGTLIFGRIDRRFWVPDGCKNAGDYARLRKEGAEGSGSLE